MAFGGVLIFLVGVTVGWTARELATYDNCLDRINYDKALWHLCDNKEPRANTSPLFTEGAIWSVCRITLPVSSPDAALLRLPYARQTGR